MRMMSICLTRFPFGVLGEPYIYHDLGVFYKKVGRLWKVSDCEELVGILLGDCLTCEELVGVTWRLSDL